jgi:L-iditol 2-dehydrogenase
MGLVNAQAARVYGARVIVTELMEKKLDCARKLGFNVIDSSKQDPVQAVKDLTDGKGADVEILAVGASSANQQALEMAKKIGAKILFFAAGYPAPELKIGSNEIHYRKIELIGTFCANIADFQDSARMISNKCVNMGPLIEGHFRLDEIQKAYELASTPGSYRVAVHMWDE